MVEDGGRGRLGLDNPQPQTEAGVHLPGPRDLLWRAWASSRPLTFVGEPYRYPWGLAAIPLDQEGSPLLLLQEAGSGER